MKALLLSVSFVAMNFTLCAQVQRPSHAAPMPPEELLPATEDEVTKATMRVLSEPHQFTRETNFAALLTRTPAGRLKSVREAFRLCNRVGMDWFFREWETLWIYWGDVAPEDALSAEAVVGEPPKVVADARVLALRSWASLDPRAAQRWLENSIHRGEMQFMRSLVGGWAAHNLKEATEFVVNDLGGGSIYADTSAEALRDAAVRQGFTPGLTAWFQSLPEAKTKKDFQSVAIQHVWWKLDRIGFSEAAKFLTETQTRPLLRRDDLIEITARKYVEKGSPEKAVEWAVGLGKSPQTKRFTGIEVIGKLWPEKDKDGFQAWLLKNRQHLALDQILCGFVRYLIALKSDEAERWAREIKDEDLRESTLEEYRSAKVRW